MPRDLFVAVTIYTAEFPKTAMAKKFYDRLAEGGPAETDRLWYATDLAWKGGRTVTWTGPATDEYLMDMRETVGYYGSTMDRKAKLNGHPTPIAY